MKIAHNLIGTLGVGESSFYTYRDDCRGRRRMLRQETGAVGQRREKLADGLYRRHGMNMWLGRVWACLCSASMFSTIIADGPMTMPVSLSIHC